MWAQRPAGLVLVVKNEGDLYSRQVPAAVWKQAPALTSMFIPDNKQTCDTLQRKWKWHHNVQMCFKHKKQPLSSICWPDCWDVKLVLDSNPPATKLQCVRSSMNSLGVVLTLLTLYLHKVCVCSLHSCSELCKTTLTYSLQFWETSLFGIFISPLCLRQKWSCNQLLISVALHKVWEELIAIESVLTKPFSTSYAHYYFVWLEICHPTQIRSSSTKQ